MRLLLSLVGFLVATLVGASPEWRLSDALGNDRGPAPRGGPSEGWVLRVERGPLTEERTLFQGGSEESRRVLDWDEGGRPWRLREFRGPDPVWEVAYDPNSGLPIAETAFQEGLAVEVARLTFVDNLLVTRRVEDPAGNLLYTDTLRRWPDGRVRRLERDGPSGPQAGSAWSYGAQGALTEAWAATGPEGRDRREWVLSPGKTEETRWSGEQVILTRVTDWVASGGSREVVTEPQVGRTLQRTLDAQGRVTVEVESVRGTQVQTRRWAYDGQGRLTEATVDSAGPREVWTYTYGEDVLGRLTRGGILVREETTRDGETKEVRLFDRGDLFLVETWSGGKRTKETYYRQGVVIRERTR